MEKLLAAVNKAKSSNGSDRDDKVFYYPSRDTAGNGSAVIRFLPGKTDDDIPFVKVYSHGFKGPTGQWFIEDCPTTIGQPCYCCEQNSILWNTGIKANQDIVRERKRKVSYISSILVVKDEKNPENEGKIFLFKYGQKIFDKITNMLSPTFVDSDEKEEFINKYGEEYCDVFDLKNGADFKFKIRKVEGQTNYDKSEFAGPSKVSVDLSSIEPLDQFTDPTRFKSAEDLQKHFDRAIGNTVRLAAKVSNNEVEPHVQPKPTKTVKQETSSSEDDELLEFMNRLNQEE